MKVLIVKTSSLGDIIHTLPALTDAALHYPTIKFDWVIEEAFKEIPLWHDRVDRVIPVAIRRWRKNLLKTFLSSDLHASIKTLRRVRYDMVIDAQGLIKSAFIAALARSRRSSGLSWDSAREKFASLLYHRQYHVNKNEHAVTRVRELFAKSLGYPTPEGPPNYAINVSKFPASLNSAHEYFVFLHGTTWSTKHWPESYWRQLAEIAEREKHIVYLPWGNELEKQRAERIQQGFSFIRVLPRLRISELAALIAKARGVVGVDTGFSHIAAALSIPTVSLYGPTDAKKSGPYGEHQHHLSAKFSCAPCMSRICHYSGARLVEPACFEKITPKLVWDEINNQAKNLEN